MRIKLPIGSNRGHPKVFDCWEGTRKFRNTDRLTVSRNPFSCGWYGVPSETVVCKAFKLFDRKMEANIIFTNDFLEGFPKLRNPMSKNIFEHLTTVNRFWTRAKVRATWKTAFSDKNVRMVISLIPRNEVPVKDRIHNWWNGQYASTTPRSDGVFTFLSVHVSQSQRSLDVVFRSQFLITWRENFGRISK